ncbi:hypothetical protein N018_09855 [Pseudomonas syringae CC1557]|uniref:Uncharacterized protein n=1 Tax=Pseudomonas syringae CC1557 TaxID=1357279 RepID=W0N3B7_PSESX|nr:hypothetical protein N018_09855 [Pseudomonas syringae CC1557]
MDNGVASAPCTGIGSNDAFFLDGLFMKCSL